MTDELKIEVDRNYDFFQRRLSEFLAEHSGHYVLLKSERVVDFFSGAGDAYRAGLSLYPDRLFSIQKVTDEPVELGLMAVAYS